MTISALIVDDQEDIRFLVRTIIDAANDGLTVCCEASGGQEALDVLDEHEPTVVVLDEMMPGMTGLETAGEILRRNPAQRILLFSAYLDEELERRAALGGITACLPKERVLDMPAALRALG